MASAGDRILQENMLLACCRCLLDEVASLQDERVKDVVGELYLAITVKYLLRKGVGRMVIGI